MNCPKPIHLYEKHPVIQHNISTSVVKKKKVCYLPNKKKMLCNILDFATKIKVNVLNAESTSKFEATKLHRHGQNAHRLRGTMQKTLSRQDRGCVHTEPRQIEK